MASNETPHGTMQDGVGVSTQGEGLPVATGNNQKCKVMKMQGKQDMTTAKAGVLSALLKEDENRARGQTHGAKGASIGGIAGCISLKQRNGATHYAGVFVVDNMQKDAPRFVKVRAMTAKAGMTHAVHCFAHGTQRPVPNRRAGMHSVRCAGKSPNGEFAKGAVSKWCGKCVKDYESRN